MGKRFLSAVSLGFCAVVAIVACGGDKFTAAADGGGADGSVDAGVDSGPDVVDAAPMCILPPNGVGNEGEFCSMYAQVLSRCGNCEPCHQLDENDCVALGDALSGTYKRALLSCQSQLTCDDLAANAGNGCVRQQLQTAQPNQGQMAAQMAYCQTCPNNHFECQHYFDFTPDAGAGAGYGGWALLMNDRLVQQLITMCSMSNPAKCDAVGYTVCAALIFCGAAPHSMCPKGLCK